MTGKFQEKEIIEQIEKTLEVIKNPLRDDLSKHLDNKYLKEIYNNYILPFQKNPFYDELRSIKQIAIYLQRYRCIMTKQQNIVEQQKNVLILDKNARLFKGMDWFYTQSQEQEYFDGLQDNQKLGWFSSSQLSFEFASSLQGGLYVYIPKRKLKILIVNEKTLPFLLSQLKEFPKIQKILRSQHCFRMDPGQCAKQYLYNQHFSPPLYIYTEENVGSRKADSCSKPGPKQALFWHKTKQDREVAQHLKSKLQQEKYDGYLIPEIQSLYYFNYIAEQLILFDPQDILKRDKKSPVDWEQWPKSLLKRIPCINDQNFTLNHKMSYGFQRNHNFKLTQFYQDNVLDSPSNVIIQKQLTALHTKYKDKLIIISTFNVHQFESINMKQTVQQCADVLLQFIQMFDIDIICLQDCSIAGIEYIKKQGINVPFYEKETELAVIIKDISVFKIKEFYIYKEKGVLNLRGYLLFTYKDILFANTHLDIGVRFSNQQSIPKEVHEIKQVMNTNFYIRSKQIKELIAANSQVILGDFNMEYWTQEFPLLSNKYTIPDLNQIKVTTVHNNRVDYIGYLQDSINKNDLTSQKLQTKNKSTIQTKNTVSLISKKKQQNLRNIAFVSSFAPLINISDHLPILHAITYI